MRSPIGDDDALFREHRFGLWSVRLKSAPALVGFAGRWPFRDPPDFELLYGVAEPPWGQELAVDRRETVGGLDTIFFERIR